jgi:hypothetical protein
MDGVEQPINGDKKSYKIFCSHIFIMQTNVFSHDQVDGIFRFKNKFNQNRK